ncbi:MAG: aldehyde dehydrogenase family protein [Urechidicola sp.]|nr:aldehyde dehydrogenase family protein [Urechidicola sp.]
MNNITKKFFFIDGKDYTPKTFYKHINPNNNQVFCDVGIAENDEINLAVESSKKAFMKWSKSSIKERISILQKVYELLIQMYGAEGEKTPLKELICNETGKRLPESDIEVIESSDMVKFYIDHAKKLLIEEKININKELWPTKESFVVHEPIGVIGVIKAWNYPLEIPIWSIVPAIISGNTVVFKPSERSSSVGLKIAEIFDKAGLPNGVLNVVTGDANTGKLLTQHNDINMIDFTGGTISGIEVAKTCASGLKKYNLELGGNDTALVCQDADIELATNGIVWGSFCNSGQVCVGIKRVLVHNSVKKLFLDKVVEKTNTLKETVDYGPLISEDQLLDVQRFIDDAISKGADIVTGGVKIDSLDGFYYKPTVLTNISTNMKLIQEECFGPVMPIIFFDDIDDAIKDINSSKYGLGASVWTSNNEYGKKIAQNIQSGMVWVNDVNVAFAEAPWGGIKDSGNGISLSAKSIYEYTYEKHISIDNSVEIRRSWWYPYE